MNTSKIIEIEEFPCPFCCPKDDEFILTARYLLHDLPGEFTVVKCRTCGLMRTNPRPTQDNISFFYPNDYGPFLNTQVPQIKFQQNSVTNKMLKLLGNKIFNFKGNFIPKLSPGRMLEIGCASGAFLHQMDSQGWNVQGIEFSEKSAQRAAQLGYRVYAGLLETAPPPEELFDLIVGWMVLEHLYDPISSLQKLRKWAKPGAWLVLSIPNAGSLEFRLFKDKWYALQVPTHLYHFTPTTLKKIMRASEWSLVKVHHQRTLSNLIGSLGYVLRDMGYSNFSRKFIDFPERGGKWTYALYPLAWLLSTIGQTGRMTVWARNKF